MNNFSIVVQGPFDNYIWNRFHYTDNYLKYVDKVIISCYTNDDTTSLEAYIKGNERVVLVKNECPSFHCNPCNMYVQAFSTLRGLEKVDTEFAIKIRANQFYTQIDKLTQAISEFPDKYTVCNINTIKVKRCSWQTSDHLFGGKTATLCVAMQQVLDWCHIYNTGADKHSHLRVDELAPHPQNTERTFFFAVMKARGLNVKKMADVSVSREDVVKIMRSNIHIVDVEDLSPYVFSWHGGSGIEYSEKHNNQETARNIEELGEDVR